MPGYWIPNESTNPIPKSETVRNENIHIACNRKFAFNLIIYNDYFRISLSPCIIPYHIVVCNLLTPSLRQSCRVDSPTTCLRQSYATQKSRKNFKNCFKILRLSYIFDEKNSSKWRTSTVKWEKATLVYDSCSKCDQDKVKKRRRKRVMFLIYAWSIGKIA